jgi:hypothetical protein
MRGLLQHQFPGEQMGPPPHTFGVTEPPHVCGAVHDPHGAVRRVPQLSSFTTAPQFFSKREQNVASDSGTQALPPPVPP